MVREWLTQARAYVHTLTHIRTRTQDNVALIAVLEAIEPGPPEAGGRRTLICVANTHIHANPELNDVKLWQVHTLLKGLEKIAARCAGAGR